MRWLVALLTVLAVSSAAHAQPVNAGHVTAEIVAETQGIAPGQTIHLALRQQIEPGWHTYWRNAGDSGEPTRLSWTLPAGWKAGDFIWPTPKRLPVGPLVNYGYEGDVLLPVPVTAPADAKVGQSVTLKAAAGFLVCKEICVPEDAALQITLPVTPAPAPPDPNWGAAVRAAVANAPKPAGLTAVFEKQQDAVTLAITGAVLKGADIHDVYFYPYDSTVIDHAKPQGVERGPEGLTITLAPGYAFQAPARPKTMAGVLAIDDRAYEITAAPGAPPPGARGLGPPAAKAKIAGAGLGLASAAIFAFLGGLILNLMPCVFPVLAMKAASLAGHGGREEARARKHGLAFGAGVLITFLALAGLLIGLKAAGSAIGWGFQLQSPPVVAVLGLLMLAIALDLSGVFEVGTSLQGVGSGLAAKGGLAGDVFTGALAVVVAAPCTAPFMGTAIGWALTQPPAAGLAVFLALGVGFALPFVLVTFWPGLLTRLPKPGPWMDVFRKALAFPMYGAAAWLAWVLTLQAGASALARILIASIVLGLAAWLAGLAQRRAAAGGRPLATGAAATILALSAVTAVIWPAYAETPMNGAAGATSAEAAFEPYTPERLAALRAEGKPVFVNYTAAWCVSCQVNDRVVISTAPVVEAMRKNGVTYLKADWTKRDPVIAAELARFGRAGVPLYLVYGANGGEPVILPAILTQGMVVKALEAAARRP